MALNRRQTLKATAAGALATTLAGTTRGATPAPSATTLWYRQPADTWTEALPIGNGVLGAMVFGGIGHERLQLNEGTLWAGQPYDPVNPDAKAALPQVRALIFAGKFAEAERLANAKLMARPLRQMPYQALGDLLLDFPGLGETTGYHRQLDLDSAIATTQFTAQGGQHERHVIASPGDRVIAVRLTAPRGGLDVDIRLSSPQLGAITRAIGTAQLLMTGTNGAADGIAGGLTFAARVSVQADGGRVTVRDDAAIEVRGADAVTVLVAMATSYRRFDDVSGKPELLTADAIARATRRGFARIAADATARHRTLFRRMTIDLGRSAAASEPTDRRIAASQSTDDPALAALYLQYARYLLISCSQPGGQAATLQGLWNDSLKPPWGSKYTININTQMNYWPAHPANLAECIAPLVQLVREIAETGERTAREMYGARGWVAHHNVDLWRATAPIDGAQYGLWPSGGAWLCTHLWEHYDYTRDLEFLRSVYPLMAGAARFFLDTLQRDPNTGFLVTNPSLSPENPHGHGGSLAAGPTMDMGILRDLFDQTIAAAGVLHVDQALIIEMQAARDRLAPYRIGAQGQLQEWQDDWDGGAPEQHHRHVSHLYGVYPSNQISVERTPALAEAAKRTLEIRGDMATGWAIAWRINLWARLRDGERAHKILKLLLAPERTYPNMFDAHPPFQIDGNFGGAAAILEMLVHSYADTVHLLPALPRDYPTGSVTGLRLRGACGLDMWWSAGRLDRAVLRPDRDGARTILSNGVARRVTLSAGRSLNLTPSDFAGGSSG
ncbi:glycoside hydrolase family 95 protein [Sphingomonas sp. 4RDLI-65]|uniref:glycoside hydrolase family 95 protein n=1 Tax=Sphingomonas sp. 4RDLI-65 TaxID=3111641 RepID=UPI003C28334F